jgi:hypothetical protein
VSDIETYDLPHLGKDVDEKELARRKHTQAVFQMACAGDNGNEFLVELGEILHFFGPAYTPEDMVLQNAFKTVLHRLGSWADDDAGRMAIIRKLRGPA